MYLLTPAVMSVPGGMRTTMVRVRVAVGPGAGQARTGWPDRNKAGSAPARQGSPAPTFVVQDESCVQL